MAHKLPILLALTLTLATAQNANSKRGLVYIPSADPNDTSLYTRSGSDLAWYYNYGLYPTSGLDLPFVPMLHSLPDSAEDFTSAISSLVDGSSPPKHLLTFNEPDMSTDVGGSEISASDAAQFYISYVLPLRGAGSNHMKVSLPSTSGSGIGLSWLRDFNASCHKLNPKKGCPADFLATHWYGDFAGMASWLGQIHALYPSLPIWITEFAEPTVTLEDTQQFFNQSTSYLGRLNYIDAYCWFGTFRADSASGFVGPNASFLDDGGQLTDLGSWYLGGSATGNLPSDGVAALVSQTPNFWFFVALATFLAFLA